MSFELGQAQYDELDAQYAASTRLGRAIRLFLRKPRLIPYALACATRGATAGLRDDPTLGWLSSLNHVRRVNERAILGAEWGGVSSFMAVFRSVAYPAARCLEIGCGGGRMTRLMRPHVAALSAVDVSEPILDEARRVMAGLGVTDFFVVTRFGDNLPIAAYDLVASHDVFVHFDFDEISRYAHNVNRALGREGYFVLSVYTLDSESERQDYIAQIGSSPTLSARRARRMPACAFEAIFRSTGFEVLRKVRSEVNEYAVGKSTGHLNYVLCKKDHPQD